MADFGRKMMHVQNSENNFPNKICEGKCLPKQDRDTTSTVFHYRMART